MLVTPQPLQFLLKKLNSSFIFLFDGENENWIQCLILRLIGENMKIENWIQHLIFHFIIVSPVDLQIQIVIFCWQSKYEKIYHNFIICLIESAMTQMYTHHRTPVPLLHVRGRGLSACAHQTIQVHSIGTHVWTLLMLSVMKESSMECSSGGVAQAACSLQHSELYYSGGVYYYRLSRAQYLLAMSCSIDRQWTSYPAWGTGSHAVGYSKRVWWL